MAEVLESQLARLSEPTTTAKLSELGFDWSAVDGNTCAAVRFRQASGDVPSIVGLLGGASSGKSTLFNSIVGREVSRTSAHAHETLGPIAAVHRDRSAEVGKWMVDRLLFPALDSHSFGGGGPTVGATDALTVVEHESADALNVILLDLPDVTSRMATHDGAVTETLLPWFDALVVVVDEERWFDAAVFEDTAGQARELGTQLWVVFNRTEPGPALTVEQERKLADHARARGAVDYCIGEFCPGMGYRPAAPRVRDQVLEWFGEIPKGERSTVLGDRVRRGCARLLRMNMDRSRGYEELHREVTGLLSTLCSETSLSADLLTTDERRLIGIGHRFVPLYDVYRAVRQRFDLFRGRRTDEATEDVDFDKQVELLADVLRRNLETRYRHAADRISECVTDSAYLGDDAGSWDVSWDVPAFDERQWAVRIRSHIDAWKGETRQQSRKSDYTALSVGVPLLAADLLFLGGAGTTLSWTAVWAAGMFGGKAISRTVRGSPAYDAYQSTVTAYQAFIRESLTEQCASNFSAIPRRHLAVSDPILDSVMACATPGGG